MSDAVSQVLFDGELFAGHFQIDLREDGNASLPDGASEEALRRRATSATWFLAIHTARNMTVPVRVELHVGRPGINCDAFQHVVEASFSAPLGLLVVAGLTDETARAVHLPASVGPLGACVTFQGLDPLDEIELKGENRYAVHLWRVSSSQRCECLGFTRTRAWELNSDRSEVRKQWASIGRPTRRRVLQLGCTIPAASACFAAYVADRAACNQAAAANTL